MFCLESGWTYLVKSCDVCRSIKRFQITCANLLIFKTQISKWVFYVLLWMVHLEIYYNKLFSFIQVIYVAFFVGRLAKITIIFDNYFWLTSRSYFSFTIATDHTTRLKFCAKNKDIFYNSQDSLQTKIHRHNHPTFQISNLSLAHFFGLKWTFYSLKCKISSAQVWNHSCS